MEYIEMNEKLVDVFFCGYDENCKENIKKIVKLGNCFVIANTGELVQNKELIKNKIGTGVYTDYFETAIFYHHAFSRYERENLYEEGFWCNEKETQRIQTGVVGSDGWDLFYDEETGETKKVWRLEIEVEEDEWQVYNVWFDDKDFAIVVNL